MNKRLEELLEQVPHWPPGAQDRAVSALAGIEEAIVVDPEKLSPEDQQKLKALREMVEKSIAEGGDYSDEDIGTMIDEMVERSPYKGR
jgi:hypothetical protein